MKVYKVIQLPTFGTTRELRDEGNCRVSLPQTDALNKYAKEGYRLIAINGSIVYLEKDV